MAWGQLFVFPAPGGYLDLISEGSICGELPEQSVELVKSCAQRHQVIFLTCKEDLAEVLGGHRIDMA